MATDRTGPEGLLASEVPRENPVAIPIDGTLDLHTFAPRELGQLVPAYLRECRARGILQVRIVHGKGSGAQRRQVHALLGHLPEVAHFVLADLDGGSWGATMVNLRPPGR
jgi:DNA-nicking Smr family endonuclease